MSIKYTTEAVNRIDLGQALEMSETAPMWIHDMVAPFVPVDAKDGKYATITSESILQLPSTKRNKDGSYNTAEFETVDKSFSTENYGINVNVSDIDSADFGRFFDVEMQALRIAERIVKANAEKRVKDIIHNTTTFASGNSNFLDYSSAPWATVSSDIVAQIQAGKQAVFDLCGYWPNAVQMSKKLENYCVANTGIKGRIQNTEVVSDQLIRNSLATIFGVQHVIVGDAGYDIGSGPVEIWGDNYVSVFVLGDNRLGVPNLINTPKWTAPYGSADYVVSTLRDEIKEKNIIRVKNHVDEHLVDKNFGCLLDVKA